MGHDLFIMSLSFIHLHWKKKQEYHVVYLCEENKRYEVTDVGVKSEIITFASQFNFLTNLK